MTVFKNKKILITGGAGFIGTNLIRRLLQNDIALKAVIHEKEPVILNKKVEYLKCDLTKMEDCIKAVKGIDLVFHCAANTSGAAVIEKTPLIHLTPNILMNAQLLEASYSAGVEKFLWLSSSTGYPPSEGAAKEDEMMVGEPYEKYFCVGWMKRYTEVLCRIYAQKVKNPITTIILRPTNIYGGHDDFEFATSHVFAALIRRVIERQNPLEVWGTGENLRDLIYVGDFINAMLLAMERVHGYDVFNIGAGEVVSIKELLAIMLEVDDYRGAEIKFDPSKPTTIPVRRVDTTKAKDILGFRPQVALREGIEKTLLWYRENKFNNLR
ncbi:MAG: NAD-dependent epimerase/dehydratase family protein [Candidatus Saelkia tenebricola]|nr:NAD-dependent epimerase/dehydratase family protein [Candidatus Saelkia tenebricola]